MGQVLKPGARPPVKVERPPTLGYSFSYLMQNMELIMPEFSPDRIPGGGIAIEFPDENPRVAGQLASDLKTAIDNAIVDSDTEAETTIENVDPNAQDLGTILAITVEAKPSTANAIAAECFPYLVQVDNQLLLGDSKHGHTFRSSDQSFLLMLVL